MFRHYLRPHLQGEVTGGKQTLLESGFRQWTDLVQFSFFNSRAQKKIKCSTNGLADSRQKQDCFTVLKNYIFLLIKMCISGCKVKYTHDSNSCFNLYFTLLYTGLFFPFLFSTSCEFQSSNVLLLYSTEILLFNSTSSFHKVINSISLTFPE